MTTPTAVVVGGGITGLSAAYDFHRAGWRVEVYEASDRWGGKILTSLVGDRLVDAAADAFLARVEHGYQLCFELGLEDDLTTPVAPVPAYLFVEGHLHELPSRTILGVPTDLASLVTSDLVSSDAVERAQRDLTLPPPDLDADPSVGAVCRERLGDEITDRLVDPLLGSINASDIDHLSLISAAPQLAEALRAEGSLIRGLNRFRSSIGPSLGSGDPDAPVFYGLPGGIATIVDRLVEELAGAELHLARPIERLTDLSADAVVLAVPAFAAAELLADHGPVGELLTGVDYASVAQVTIELPIGAIDPVLDAAGILFPRADGRLMTACTWLSTKWRHYHSPHSVLIRLSAGRYGDDRPSQLTDAELTAALVEELATVVNISEAPIASRVQRWPRAFPQYAPGHAPRVAAIREALADAAPRISLVGAAYDGIGIPACIASGRGAARAVIEG